MQKTTPVDRGAYFWEEANVNVQIKTKQLVGQWEDPFVTTEMVGFGGISLKNIRNNPAALQFMTQTFLIKKRKGDFAITKDHIVSKSDRQNIK